MMRLLQSLARARDGVPLAVNQPLDLKHKFHIPTPVKALARAALVGLQLRKLRLPETQNIRLNLADLRYVADLEVETVWDRRCFLDALSIKLSGHETKWDRVRGDRAQSSFHLQYRLGLLICNAQNGVMYQSS